ncbi:MAG: R3H domain-containing nucleic acid-binding protein, partial [Candidatus Binataceae bacterium]
SSAGQPVAEKRVAEAEGEAGDEGRRSAGLEEQGREAISILSQILELMGEKAEIRTAGRSSSEEIEVQIKGDGSGILIGRHGQTLDAIEYLVNRILARRIKDAVPVSIDTESYRERRHHQLERMALSMGERVKREHIKMALEPMSPRDRRIVHLALKDDPLLTTHSSGDGYMRTVEIAPVEGRQERGPRSGRGTGRPRQEPEPPIGQQGGFKHGQKRIV